MASYRPVTKRKLNAIVIRLQRTTVATKASRHDFNNQESHVAYIRRGDPRALSASSKSSVSTGASSHDEMVGRLTRPTTASSAARHDFDAQKCHLDYLSQTLDNYPPPQRVVSDEEELTKIAEKLTTPTAASKAARHDFDAQKEHVVYLERIDPNYPGHKKYGYRRKTAPFIDVVDSAKLDQMVERWTKPTVASQGGAPLHDKDFTYIKPPPTKTNIQYRGLDKKFKGQKRMSTQQMADCVSRLSTPFKRNMNNSSQSARVR